jgi:phosphate starvation-inducible protein PhoH and related proteins
VVKEIAVPSPCVSQLFAGAETKAQVIERAVRPFALQISPWSDGVRIAGDEPAVTICAEILDQLVEAMQRLPRIDDDLVTAKALSVINGALKHSLVYHLTGLPHPVRPMSLSQVAFMDGILHSGRELTFSVGATGTGKTHLAVAAGLHLVTESHFKTLIITRPRVAMEGEIMTAALRAETSSDEQFTPIDDILCDLLGHDEAQRRKDHGLIEIVPLGRMRGRTFNGSFIVVDEAQNMTVAKMRMVLTRLGRGSRMVVTGDPTQCDLQDEEPSGLGHILPLIRRAGIASVHHFDNNEIVRNELVAQIEALYSQGEASIRRAAA